MMASFCPFAILEFETDWCDLFFSKCVQEMSEMNNAVLIMQLRLLSFDGANVIVLV